MHDTFYNVPEPIDSLALSPCYRRAPMARSWRISAASGADARPIGGGGLSSTANDYIRFVRMLLNGGTLNGVRILSADTVALMSRNQIGTVGVPP